VAVSMPLSCEGSAAKIVTGRGRSDGMSRGTERPLCSGDRDRLLEMLWEKVPRRAGTYRGGEMVPYIGWVEPGRQKESEIDTGVTLQLLFTVLYICTTAAANYINVSTTATTGVYSNPMCFYV
jgi:hypothetical protein